MASRPILAAGAVVLRDCDDHREVLLVHRPRYGDWTLPKGKVKDSELSPVAAVREVREETGVTVRLGQPLGSVTYPVDDRLKQVDWWAGHVVAEKKHKPDREVDQVAWVPVAAARTTMTYLDETEILDKALAAGPGGRLLVVRHAKAKSRAKFQGPSDAERPLARRGRRQADSLVALLGAYGVDEVVSSSWLRCVETVQPYATARDLHVRRVELLTEERGAEHPGQVRKYLERLASYAARHSSGAIVVCGHRPVLPDMFAGCGVADRPMHTAELIVVHLDPEDGVVAVEDHRSPGHDD